MNLRSRPRLLFSTFGISLLLVILKSVTSSETSSVSTPLETNVASGLGYRRIAHHAHHRYHQFPHHRRDQSSNTHESEGDDNVVEDNVQHHNKPRDFDPFSVIASALSTITDTVFVTLTGADEDTNTDTATDQATTTYTTTVQILDTTTTTVPIASTSISSITTTTITTTTSSSTSQTPSTNTPSSKSSAGTKMSTTGASYPNTTSTKTSPTSTSTASNDQTSPNSTTPGVISAIYYVNWAIYARNHFPWNLPASQFTHILYAFAGVSAATGEIYLTNPNADTNKKFPTDPKSEPGYNLYGCAKQFLRIKRANRNVKTLLSIGGASLSLNITPAIASADNRQRFANSAVAVLENLGFDGLDIDYEFPANATQASNFVDLLRLTRAALDAAAARRNWTGSDSPNGTNSTTTTRGSTTRFLLTAAVPAGPSNYKQLNVRDMNQYLDFWNLMAYDYAGTWSTLAGHQANVYTSSANRKLTPYSSSNAMEYYIGQGVAPRKMVLGMPLYGRQFNNTNGVGSPYNGTGPGSWMPGIWDYKALPFANANVTNDPSIGATLSYDSVNRTLITFDDVVAAKQKADYVRNRGLGGGMWWESSGDKPIGNGSLVEAFVGEVGGTGVLDQTLNCMNYPYSKYDNVRTGIIQ